MTKGCKIRIWEPNNPQNCTKLTISQFAISSKWTSLKSLRLLQFSKFFDADFGNVFRTKFGAYMMSRIFDFFSKKFLRAIYEKIRDFFAKAKQIDNFPFIEWMNNNYKNRSVWIRMTMFIPIIYWYNFRGKFRDPDRDPTKREIKSKFAELAFVISCTCKTDIWYRNCY